VQAKRQISDPRKLARMLIDVYLSDEEFITIILWDSVDDVRAIAGRDCEKAVTPEDRLPLLWRYDAGRRTMTWFRPTSPLQHRSSQPLMLGAGR
jgi:hypothetical protein